MILSRIGIFRCLISEGGDLLTLPADTGLLFVGDKKPSMLQITQFKIPSDYRHRRLRNMLNFRYAVTSYQSKLRDLNWLKVFYDAGTWDAQIVAEDQGSTPGDGGRFDFVENGDGEPTIGIDFKMTYGDTDRFMEFILETALPFTDGKALIDLADGYGAIVPDITSVAGSGGNQRGIKFADTVSPYYFKFESPDSSEIFTAKEIKSRLVTIESIGTKNQYNETMIEFFKIRMEIIGRNAVISKMVSMLGYDLAPSITFHEKNTATHYEGIEIAANVLTATAEFDLGDESRDAKFVAEGNIALNQMSFAYGDPNGGDAADDTAEQVGAGSPAMTETESRTGGTLTISA